MKKLLFLLFMALGLPYCLSVSAQGTIIPLTSEKVIRNTGSQDPARGELDTPLVYLDAHTLTFSPTHPEYILYIKDENETVVYSTVVSESETTAVLPAALSGSYEIVLVMGNWMFTGWIDLAG